MLNFKPQKINNLTELDHFSRQLAKFLKAKNWPYYVLLSGDLGSGKTTLTQHLLRHFGIKDRISSPTFIILNQYQTKDQKTINHMDAYRLSKDEDLEMYEELFENSLNIIEWPERLNLDWTKVPHLKLKLKQLNSSVRLIEME